MALLVISATLLAPSEANAAASSVVASVKIHALTLATSGHYFAMLTSVAMLVFERVLIKPFLSE
jgi:hypothetical protein